MPKSDKFGDVSPDKELEKLLAARARRETRAARQKEGTEKWHKHNKNNVVEKGFGVNNVVRVEGEENLKYHHRLGLGRLLEIKKKSWMLRIKFNTGERIMPPDLIIKVREE